MDALTAPDGSRPEVMYSTTLLGFTLPPRQTAALFATSDADWEQAALVYLQGYRLHNDLGNYERLVTMLISWQDYPQQLLFTGWHKEGRPDAGLPWLPSHGIFGPSFVAWKDTPAENAPYNDLRIDIVLAPPIGQAGYRVSVAERPSQLSALSAGGQEGTAHRALEVAHLLKYFTTLAEAGQTTWSGALDTAPDLGEAVGRVIDAYLAASQPREAWSESAADLLVAELLWRAHSLASGSLRDRLVRVAEDVVRRARSRTRNHKPH